MCGLSFSQSSRQYSDGLSIGLLSSLCKLTSLLLALACLTLTGCENPLPNLFNRTPEIYIPAGKCAEVRKPTKVLVWSHQDGKPIKGYYMAYVGSNVGPGVPSSATPPAKESAVK